MTGQYQSLFVEIIFTYTEMAVKGKDFSYRRNKVISCISSEPIFNDKTYYLN